MKRSISFLLALCLIVSSLSVTAFATDEDSSSSGGFGSDTRGDGEGTLSFVGQNWACRTVGKSVTVTASVSSDGMDFTSEYEALKDRPSKYGSTVLRFSTCEYYAFVITINGVEYLFAGTPYFSHSDGISAMSVYRNGVLLGEFPIAPYTISFDILLEKGSTDLYYYYRCLRTSGSSETSLSSMRNFSSVSFFSDIGTVASASIRACKSTVDLEPTGMLSYIFDASLPFSTTRTSAIEAIYDSQPDWSSVPATSYLFYDLPSGTSIYSNLTVLVEGFSGFGSDDSMPHGTLTVYSVTDDGKRGGLLTRVGPVVPDFTSDGYKYKFPTSFVLPGSNIVYPSSLFYCFSLGGDSYPLNGLTLSCKVLQAPNIYIKTLGTISSSSEINIEDTTKNIYDTVVANNKTVLSNISTIISHLKSIGTDVSSIKGFVNKIVTAINDLGTDLDSVLTYLQSIVSSLEYLPLIYNRLNAVGLSEDTIQALASAIAAGISLEGSDLSQLENYLSSILNQCEHLDDLVVDLSYKLDTGNSALADILGELSKMKPDVAFCVQYLTGIYNTLSMMATPVQEARDYLYESKNTLLSILNEMQSFDAVTKATLDSVLANLVSQGADLSSMKSYLALIHQNGLDANALLSDLLAELQKVEAANTETNERLKAIQEVLEDFEVTINKTVNEVINESDQRGLQGLISRIVSALLSVIDFVGDLFGSIFTSVPSTISAFNDCTAFWGDSKTYVYTPHQVAGYGGTGASYENSNESVQALFVEAEKYLGYPYVFGGSSPTTSFDCSGFVCYALNQSGVYSTARITAQGLFDACAPVDQLTAMPGDLVFFTGTYDSGETVSHVGIYAGDGRMLHCGDPVQYATITTAYWQSHLYGFGRLPYNAQ